VLQCLSSFSSPHLLEPPNLHHGQHFRSSSCCEQACLCRVLVLLLPCLALCFLLCVDGVESVSLALAIRWRLREPLHWRALSLLPSLPWHDPSVCAPVLVTSHPASAATHCSLFERADSSACMLCQFPNMPCNAATCLVHSALLMPSQALCHCCHLSVQLVCILLSLSLHLLSQPCVLHLHLHHTILLQLPRLLLELNPPDTAPSIASLRPPSHAVLPSALVSAPMPQQLQQPPSPGASQPPSRAALSIKLMLRAGMLVSRPGAAAAMPRSLFPALCGWR
jgi:hypothetical protein